MSPSGAGEPEPLDLFLRCGLEEKTAQNALANGKFTASLTAVIHEVRWT